MTRMVCELIIYGLALGLFLLFGRKSRRDKAYESAGMTIVRMSAWFSYLGLALGVFASIFVAFFAVVCILDGGWEEAWPMMLLAVGISLFMVLLGAGLCIYRSKAKIIYNSEKVRICKMFGATVEMSWWEFGHIVKKGGICRVYDRNGQQLIRIDSKWDNYNSFCQYACQRIPSGKEL